MNILRAEEQPGESRRVVGILFREEVGAFHRLSMYLRSLLSPNAQWAAVLGIEGVEWAALSP
jgi:hypothetical protein